MRYGRQGPTSHMWHVLGSTVRYGSQGPTSHYDGTPSPRGEGREREGEAVSYTHLTLPTICSV
eukprot:2379803-Prymnesium_polylepis.1